MCVNLEGVAGSRGTGESLVEGLVRVLRDCQGFKNSKKIIVYKLWKVKNGNQNKIN